MNQQQIIFQENNENKEKFLKSNGKGYYKQEFEKVSNVEDSERQSNTRIIGVSQKQNQSMGTEQIQEAKGCP